VNAPTCRRTHLPAARVNRIARAFVHIVLITQIRSLSERLPIEGINRKRPIALFICLTTKALYLKLVSDYTSPTFIAAYQWFVSRRGPMHSDNGMRPTFYGADRELSNAHAKAIRNFRNRFADGTAWHFLPPLHHRTSAVCGRPVLKVLSII